jgi:hypothetical protein
VNRLISQLDEPLFARTVIRESAEKQGWSESTLTDLLARFIDEKFLAAELYEFLDEIAAYENASGNEEEGK